MNFCRHCGMKIEQNYRICPSCGNQLGVEVQTPMPMYQTVYPVQPKEKNDLGKNIVSTIFNILAFYFAFVVYINMDTLVEDCITNYGGLSSAYVIGALLWQIGFGGVALILSIISRKNKRTAFNAINMILAAINIGIIIIEFTMFMSYFD